MRPHSLPLLALAFASLAGCSQFRRFDGGDVAVDSRDIATDLTSIGDATTVDTADVSAIDATSPDVSDAGLVDAPSVDAVPVDAPPPGVRLNGRITTISDAVLSNGTRRLVGCGLEYGPRACIGTFCVTGAISP